MRTKLLVTTLGLVTLARAQSPATKTILHNFATPPKGAQPLAGVIFDAAGNLYGTTSFGGASGYGTVYKVEPSGRVKVIYSFTGGNDGSTPYAGVIRDAAGNLYGTTRDGGTFGHGTVYKIDTAGQETVLHNFNDLDGSSPTAGLIMDGAGNLYGTTRGGGASNRGVVFKIDGAGQETVLYRFTGSFDGSTPYAGVIRDAAGNLYGTTYGGGTSDYGTVYKIDSSGRETVLHSFTKGDGAHPETGVIRDGAGNLYGTTTYGGRVNVGTVFKIDSAGQETVLHSFSFSGQDGDYPESGVIRDAAGNLYGTTYSGGTSGFGTVYKMEPSGQETVLYSFKGTDGSNPQAGVLRDGAGNLYGTTFGGGASFGGASAGYGAVFKIDGSGRETVLYSFSSNDGRDPLAGVIRDGAGNLYGTTYSGGEGSDSGTVYQIDAAGLETILHSFTGVDGANPNGGVIRDGAGNLYGTTERGGAANMGTVFKIDAAGQETVLHSFTGDSDGAYPLGGVIRDGAGNLYGTTNDGGGGPVGFGTVFKIDGGGQDTVLHRFTRGADGANPAAGVTRDGAGNLYGTTEFGGAADSGTVYKIDASGNYSVIYSFLPSGTNGGYPTAGVIRDGTGNLYGTAGAGAGYGSVYRIDPAGHETVLYIFTGAGVNGEAPSGELLRDVTGNLYGTTEFGGTSVDILAENDSGYGTVYRIDSSGQFSVLYNFQGGADGANPLAGLITDGPGNLLGTTSTGGTHNGGTVFKLDLHP